jgi:adenosine deaminase
VIPKAELHVHLEGTARPELVRRIAARNGVRLPDGLFAAPDRFAWRDFLDFLAAYDLAASVIRTAQDYRDITFEYLADAAAEGAIYVELITSPDHAAAVGLSDEEHWDAVAQGIDDARAAHRIEARILSSCVRNFGVDAAEDVARRTVTVGHPYVVGFNMGGDEAGYPAGAFARAYATVAEAGLGCSVHAGEHAGPESVRAALELPGVTRVSHGVRAIEDPALVAELAQRDIVLEVCPTSNVALGLFRDYASHPFPALREAGVPLTLGSDDPPYFGASIGGEYGVARDHFGLDDAALSDITRTAVDRSFAPPELRARLLSATRADRPGR